MLTFPPSVGSGLSKPLESIIRCLRDPDVGDLLLLQFLPLLIG